MLALSVMTRNFDHGAPRPGRPPSPAMVPGAASPMAAAAAAGVADREVAAILDRLDGRSLALVGMMGAGKTTIGRRLANLLGLVFVDVDQEIEQAAGCTVNELFARFGEAQFRIGERRVIARVLAGRQAVVATGGGAVTDAETRRLLAEQSVSVWLRCRLPVLLRRVAGRTHRPLLNGTDRERVLSDLLEARQGLYALADLTVDCGEDSADQTASRVARALAASHHTARVRVATGSGAYDVAIGTGLLDRAGALLAQVLPQKRVAVVTDATVAALHLDALVASLGMSGFAVQVVTVAPGEASKRIEVFARAADEILSRGIERRTAIVALGGGVVGDLAGFLAASLLRGLPFVQIPTTLLSQVDSSVGGKTGINTASGKNLIGAFHQPLLVLADIGTLATLPRRELAAGYAEIVKAGLIADPRLFAWCERNGAALLEGDAGLLAEAVERACAFKAAVVADDERETRLDGGRALLNLGHTFGHAIEAELGYDGRLLHGEAVAIGCHLAFRLSARLGHCTAADSARVTAHLSSVGFALRLDALAERPSVDRLLGHMSRDKKMRDGALGFVLATGIGAAMTDREVPREAVASLLRDEGGAPG